MTLVRILVRSGTQKGLLFSAWLLQEHQPQFPFKLNLSISSLVQNTILPFFAFIATVTATRMQSVHQASWQFICCVYELKNTFFPPQNLLHTSEMFSPTKSSLQIASVIIPS